MTWSVLTQEEKYAAIVTDIKESMALGPPIPFGTARSIAQSTSRACSPESIAHKVLNAKFHEKEAKLLPKPAVRADYRH
jgi:preprotein translocase subunit SecA